MGKVEKITKKPEAKTQASPIIDAQMAAAQSALSAAQQAQVIPTNRVQIMNKL